MSTLSPYNDESCPQPLNNFEIQMSEGLHDRSRVIPRFQQVIPIFQCEEKKVMNDTHIFFGHDKKW